MRSLLAAAVFLCLSASAIAQTNPRLVAEISTSIANSVEWNQFVTVSEFESMRACEQELAARRVPDGSATLWANLPGREFSFRVKLSCRSL